MSVSQQLKQQFDFLNNAPTTTLAPADIAAIQKAYGFGQPRQQRLSASEREANLAMFNANLEEQSREMGKAFATNTSNLPAEARYRAWQDAQEAFKSQHANLSEEQQQTALSAFNEYADVFRQADEEAGFFSRTGDLLSYVPTTFTKLGEQAVGLVAPDSDLRKWFTETTADFENWRSDESKMRALQASDAMAQAKANGELGFTQFFANAAENPLETLGGFAESALPTVAAAAVGVAAAPVTGGTSLGLPAIVGGVQAAGATRNEIYDHIKAMPQEQLNQSPEYQALLATGLSPEQARENLASSLIEHGGEVLATGLSSAALSQLGGLGRIGQVGKGALGSTAGKFTSELLTEPADEVFQQYMVNSAIHDIDQTHSLTNGLGEAGAGGLLFGTAGGTVAAADNAYRTPSATQAQANNDQVIDDVVNEQSEPKQQAQTEQTTQPKSQVNGNVLESILSAYQNDESRFKELYEDLASDIQDGKLQQRLNEGDREYANLARAYLEQTGQLQPQQAVETPQNVVQQTRFQQYVQRVNQAYQTNDNAALEQALSEFSPEEQALFNQEVARIFIEGRPDVGAAIKQGKSLQEINDMIVTPTRYPNHNELSAELSSRKQRVQEIENDPTLDAETAAEAELQQTANVAPIQPRNVVTGTQDTVDIGENNYQPFQYEVMEAEDLLPTQQKAGNQLRDRERTASQAQVNKIARNLDPRKLVDSPTMDMGAPLLAQDGQTVIAGNGRSMALRQAYQEGNANAYKQYLQANAGKFGLDANQIAGMKNPVLVRRLNTAVDIKQTAINSNEQGGMRMSNLEQAKVDAGRLPNMANFELGENGEINTVGNQGFISQFIQNQPETLRNELLDGKGNLSQTGVQRLRNAMLYTAYGDTDTLARAVESTDQGARNIINALTRIAPKVAQVKQDIANGALSDVDISEDIVSAVEKYNQLRSQNKDVGEYLQQQDFVSELTPEAKTVLRIFNENNRSAKRISDILTGYYNSAETQGNTAQSSMFGDVDFDKAGTLEQAKNTDDIRYSQSPKSTEENIARGSQAMEQAIQYHQDVQNAMFRDGVGWIDFIWGTEGVVKESGKTKGAKGVSHIIEARMRKDNLSYAEAVAFLTQQVPDIIANGRIERDYEISGTRAIAIIRTDGSEVHLIKKGSDNAWLLTGFEPKENQQMNQSRGATTSDLRSNSPIRSRTDEGAVGTDNVHQSTPQRNRQIAQDQQTLSRILGEETASHIQVVDRNTKVPSGRDVKQLATKGVEGWFEPSTQKLYIISDNITANDVLSRDERLAWVAFHELAHAGVRIKYGHLLTNVLASASQNVVVKVLARKIQAEHGYEREIAIEEAMMEIYAAYETGNWAELESRYKTKIHESYKQGKNSVGDFLTRVANALRRLIGGIIGKDLTQTMTTSQVFDALRGIQQGINDIAKAEQNQTASDGYRYSFAGEKAQTANHSLLEQAKRAVAQGQNPETVRQETGWFTGADGKWRFEIDDSQVQLKSEFAEGEIGFAIDPDFEGKSINLEDLIDAPELFSAYPDLRTLKVDTKTTGGSFYSPSKDTISLAGSRVGQDARSSLLHEIQHAIQERENFARGANPRNFSDTTEAKLSTRPLFELLRETDVETREIYHKFGNAEIALENNPDNPKIREAYEQAQNELLSRPNGERLLEARWLVNNDQTEVSAYEQYMRTAGEVEARNVQSRMDMNNNERRAIPPEETEDRHRYKQTVSFRDNLNYELNENDNSEFAKAVEAITNGDNPARAKITLGTTPDVLKMLGIDDTNVIIMTKTLRKDMVGKHKVSPEAMKQLPKQLNDPIAVMQSRPDSTNPKAYLMLTELKEIENGKELPVIAALDFVQHDNGDLELVEISSAYGRKNVKVAKDLLHKPYYWNKTKGNQFLKDFALSAENNELLSALRTSFSSDDYLSVNNVKSEDDLRQYQSENSDNNLSETTYNQAKAEGKTELTFQQWKQVRSPEFKAWFGDWENDPKNASKVINPKTGEPLVVFHYTEEQFHQFDLSKARQSSDIPAFFFTTDPEMGMEYGNNEMQVFLNIRNLVEKPSISSYKDGRALRQELIEQGYDGTIVDDSYEDWLSIEYAALNPNQIKSATDNNGQFSSENDDIRFSLREDPNSEFAKQAEPKRRASSFDEARAIVSEFLGEPLVNKATGMVATVSKRSLEKMVSGKAAKQSSAVDDEYMELAKRYENGDHSVEPRLRELVDNQAKANGFDADISFRMDHSAPNAHDGYSVTGDNLAEMVGDDIYSSEAEMYFGTGDERADRESINQIRRMKNRPNAEVTIYRAIPKSFKGTAIGDGDWVSLSRIYTEQHGENALDGDYKIAMKKVKANELYWNGDSINEFGYDSGNNNYRSSEVNRNKSSELITRTDSGRIIPLSKRFNPDKTDIRYSVKQSVDDLAKTGKAKQDASQMSKLRSFDGFKSLVKDVGGWLDERVTDGLRPVNDWIDTFKQSGISDHEAERLKDDMYRAKGVRDALNSELESAYLNPIIKKVAAIAKANKMDELSAKRLAGYWISGRYAIEKNNSLLKQDHQAMLDAEKALNEANANGDEEAITLANREYRKAERQYRYRKHDVELALDSDEEFQVGTAGGWSNAEAANFMQNIEKHIPKKDLEALAELVYDLNQKRLEIDHKVGRYTEEQYNEYKANRHYVPLTGDPNADDDFDGISGAGSNALNVSKDRALKGRKLSEAEDGIDASWRAIGKSTTYAGWADFKNRIDFIYETKVDELVEKGYSTRSAREEVENTLGISKSKMKGLTRSNDDVLIRKVGGEYFEYRLPQKVMQALKNDNVEHANAFLKVLSKPTSWYARGVTQWNITFALMNMMRDAWEKSEFIRVQKLYDKEGNLLDSKTMDKIGRAVLKNALDKSTWAATKRLGFNQTLRDSGSEGLLKQLLKDGGVSTYSTYLAKTETDLIKKLKAENNPLAKKLEQAGALLEGYNKIFDNVSALSAYKALIDHGVDPKQAAAKTLELTNFRKTGSKMRGIKALYMFSQPTAMGARNLIKYLSTPKGQKRFIGYMAVMMPLYAALRALDDEDEGGNKMDQLGDISRYIPLPMGLDKYFKIPVGFGMPQMAWNFSVNIVKAGMADISMSEAATNMFVHSMRTFAPISPSEISAAKFPLEKLALTATPTILQPLMQNVLNRSAFGSQITTNFVRDDKLKSEQSKSTTAQFWKDVAVELNDVLGIDMHPEQIKNLFDGYGSMLGSLKELQTIFIENPNREQLGRRTRIPFLNQLIGTTNEFAIQSRYYEASEEAQTLANEYNSRKERGKLEGWLDAEKLKIVKWHERNEKLMANTTKEKSKLTRQLRSGTINANVYEARLKVYNQKMDVVQRTLLNQWREMQGLNTTKSR